MRWLDDMTGWDGSAPAALLALDLTRAGRRDLLHGLAGRVIGRPREDIEILHREGRAPRIAAREGREPGAPDLGLSLASRGRWSALAVAAGPVGIDVEIVDEAGEVPWAVLHPGERAHLAGLGSLERAAAFARLWTLKEAYLKALHWGLAREPAGIRVQFLDETRAGIDNPGEGRGLVEAVTTWRRAGEEVAAVSAVLLAYGEPRVSRPLAP